MKKIAFFGFTDELMCFAHALFNADEMLSKGWEVKIIIEGRSTALIPVLDSEKNPFRELFIKLSNIPGVISVCRACANKMGTLEEAKKREMTIDGSLLGHPSIHSYLEKGYEIVTI